MHNQRQIWKTEAVCQSPQNLQAGRRDVIGNYPSGRPDGAGELHRLITRGCAQIQYPFAWRWIECRYGHHGRFFLDQESAKKKVHTKRVVAMIDSKSFQTPVHRTKARGGKSR